MTIDMTDVHIKEATKIYNKIDEAILGTRVPDAVFAIVQILGELIDNCNLSYEDTINMVKTVYITRKTSFAIQMAHRSMRAQPPKA
jgi:hypothetical protein